MKRGRSGPERVEHIRRHRKSKFLPRLILIASIAAAVGLISFLTVFFVRRNLNKSNSVYALYSYWETYDYENVYNTAVNILNDNPFQNTALTFKGYSAFFLAVSQTDNVEGLRYVDESIKALRMALLSCNEETVAQIEYILGRAYFYKNTISSYDFYADLVVKYLTDCQERGFYADDIPEYLGLSYAALGKTKESIAAFTEALVVRDSDTLLLSIAEQYCKNGQANISKQYLNSVLSSCEDESILSRCHNLLGQIYIDEGNYQGAQKEFESILEKNENSADAHYGLGVLYEKLGDNAKARSEWRKCLKIQVDHPLANAKLAE